MSSARASTAAGAALGLTWAAALRAWMVALAGAESTFTWWTVSLVLGPGALLGAVAGWTTGRRRAGGRVPRWAPWSPAVLAVAVLEPSLLRALLDTGQGGGALLVAGAGAAGGVVLSRRSWSVGRALALCGWGFGVAAMFALGTIAGPPSSASGLLVCLDGAGLVGLLGVGAALTHREGLVLGRAGRRVAAGCAVATWCATVALVAVHGQGWSEPAGEPLAFAVWAVALAAGLGGCAVAAPRCARSLLT